MSENTKIEWATSTGNPWIGCTKVSPGCANCYAATLDEQRFSSTLGGGTKEKPVSHWGKGAPRFRTKGFWKDAVKWNREAEQSAPARLANHLRPDGGKHRPRIFPSLCDWLDDEVPIEWLADFLKLIHDTPNLDWLLLTKRPENFHKRLEEVGRHTRCGKDRELNDWGYEWKCGKAPANVWIGTSVEDQKRADERIPELLKIPAAVRFVSYEPALGPVKFTAISHGGIGRDALRVDDRTGLLGGPERHLDWVIVGGESGPKARPCNVEWIRDIVRQCQAAGVPCFVKQLGSKPEGSKWPKGVREFSNFGRCDWSSIRHSKGGDPSEWPEDLRVREFPK